MKLKSNLALITTVGAMLLTSSTYAAPTHWVTVDTSVLNKLQSSEAKSLKIEHESQGISLIKLDMSQIERLSGIIHDELHRCGGFITYESQAQAMEVIGGQGLVKKAMKAVYADYSLDQSSLVNPMIEQVEETQIRATIAHLSSYRNRHYKSDTGKQSSQWIKDTWTRLAQNRSDVKVEFYQHRNWGQPSVIMTITGTTFPNEIIVIGGHADSINNGGLLGGLFGGGANKEAPGADDNASGIATITETIRIAMANDFRPKRTIQFMAYAAEEAGLLGSKEIANKYKAENRQVIGKVQFDMTNFKGTRDKDIVLMSDFTNRAQNEFVGKLIDEYVKVPWGYSRCGYGCSDHASWSNAGFPASMPSESEMDDMNRNIHTKNDTLEVSRGNADQAAKFTQLAIAFMVELAN